MSQEPVRFEEKETLEAKLLKKISFPILHA